jgi:Diguanylate cyclase, GGDEF domain
MDVLDAASARYLLDRLVAEGVRYGRSFAVVRLQLPAEDLAGALPRLASALREADVLARMDADELIALLPETDGDGALRAAERLRDTVRDIPVLAGAAHWVGDTPRDLLGRAAWARARH